MNEDTITDLKQFIAVTVSQQTSDLHESFDELHAEVRDLREKMNSGFNSLEQKIDDLSASVAEALESSNESTDAQLKDHETRISKLKTKAA